MSDPALATRAPESDLHDEPIDDDKAPLTAASEPISTSEPTSTPGISEHCATDRPLPTTLGEAPSGTLTKWTINTPTSTTSNSREVEIYISKPSDYPSTRARLLLLLTNGTGVHSSNNQHQADMFARKGYLVIMPDMFSGDPAPNSKPEEHKLAADASWLDTVKLKVAETAKSFGLDMWLARHTEETVLPILYGVLENAKDEFADAVGAEGSIYAVGYCFGGRYVLILAGDGGIGEQAQTGEGQAEQGVAKKALEIKAGICAHGTLVGARDLNGVKKPVQLICVEDDPLFPEEVLTEGKKSLVKNGVEHEVEVFTDVPHGFAVVGEYESQAINEAQRRAFESMSKWLEAH